MNEAPKTDNKPYVAIFGDSKTQMVTKATWSLLSSHDLKLANVNSLNELEEIAPGAVLIIIKIDGKNDENIGLARRLSSNPRVVCDIVAIASDADTQERMEILSHGFDGIFNLDFVEYPNFKQVLLNRIDKGYISLENRIQQEEYRRFKASLAASPDAFIVFDENNKIFFVSEHYKTAYPISGPRMIRGVNVLDAFEMCVDEENLDRESNRYKAMNAFWTKLDGQAEYQTDDGRIWHIKAKKLPQGQGTIVTTNDITIYRQQQQQLEDKSEELTSALEKEQEASAIQKQFINMVSHEFRTPLTIIDGNTQILQRRGDIIDTEEFQRRTRTIRSAVSRLVNMMEGVLSSNMLKTGRLELDPVPTDLKELVRELCEEHADLSTDHNIKCDVEQLPDEVTLDPKLITLVISNLVSNAVKFSKDNPYVLVQGWQEGDKVHVMFQDSGIGIPENEKEKIFERYYRTTTASGIPGSGIGLHLVKDLVALHGGEIAVESEMGKGAKFVISLPTTL